MTQNNIAHAIENANKILFDLVTKLKDYGVIAKIDGNYEYSNDFTSLDFIEKITEIDFSQHDKEFTDKIEKIQSEVEKYRKAFEGAKKERDCQIAKYQKKIDDLEHDLKTAGEKIQDLAGENMKLQCERNDYKSKSEFLEVDRMRVKQNEFTDFLPTEPIKVADMLINDEGEYEHNPLVKKICGTDKGKYRIFDISGLRQIAEHLLVYCNNNGEEN